MSKYRTQPGATVISGVDGNNNLQEVRVNSANRGMLVMDPILCKTFAGAQFFYSEAFTLAETSDAKDYIFKTPDTTEWAHLTFRLTGSAITEISLWEDTELTTTSDYTELTTYNNNRNSTDSASCLLYEASPATATDSGTRLFHMKSGAATRQSRTPMTGERSDEKFLKQNSYYRFSFATESTGNLCNTLFQWHEHTNGS